MPSGKVERGRDGSAALRAVSRFLACFAMAFICLSAVLAPSLQAAETRSLKVFYVHTGEKAVITYKRNGKFDAKGLQQLNRFLRDWRRNEPTRMDPRLFDIVWQVYKASGATDYINVVSAYRSPATNALLRSRSKGVAKQSQHMLGKAMDFYIPGVRLKTLREAGMKLQAGGVGYYPNSGSPFVHMDVGNVRAWPRMSRQELVQLFPNGKTMHIPADGKPLPGYDQAVAEYKSRGGAKIEVADLGPTKKRKGFLATLFGGGDEDEESTVAADIEESAPVRNQKTRPQAPTVAPAADDEGASQSVMTAGLAERQTDTLNAPVPASRPAFRTQPPVDDGMAVALVSPRTNAAQAALQAALPMEPPERPQEETFADLAAYKIPVPSLLGQRGMNGDADPGTLTASVAPGDLPVSDQLAAVPVPVHRPAVAEALLAKADVPPPIAPVEPEQSALSQDMIAALVRDDERQREELASIAGASAVEEGSDLEEDESVDDMADSAPAGDQVAMVTPAPAPRNPAADFGDAFDQPRPTKPAAAAVTVPSKGARPGKHDAAEASREPVRTEPKLTEQMLSQWALSKSRVEVQTKPVKAPRFVSKTIRAQPTTVYATGFSASNTGVDPDRFSGTAVNFMEVKKFNATN